MKCEICGIREATIKFTQIINQNKKEMRLCKVCAEEKGFTNPLAGFPEILGGLILGLIGELPAATREAHSSLKCHHCQLSWSEFRDKGLLGCSQCYDSFSVPMKSLLRKVHGSNKHIGNRPADKRLTGTVVELDRLRVELNRAIKAENFEHAASIRDKIRDIEANLEAEN